MVLRGEEVQCADESIGPSSNGKLGEFIISVPGIDSHNSPDWPSGEVGQRPMDLMCKELLP